ncbi:MAG: hypothetical protein GXP43_02385 [bacterium]|nr:hypothetical protein [bacterium]
MPEQKAIFYTFLSYLFLLPLFFLPYNFEIFEFNKTILTFTAAVIILAFWLIAAIRHQKIILKTSILTIPMLLFTFSQLVSTLTSVDKYLSIWGYYSRFHQSLLHSFAYLLLFHAYITWIPKKQTKKIIQVIIISTFLVSLYGFLQHFGIDANYWVQDVKNRVFSSLGQPNWLASWLILTTPLGFIYLNKHHQTTSYLYFILNTITLLFTKSKSGYLGFLIALLLLIIIPSLNRKKTSLSFSKTFLIPLIIFITASFFIWNPANLYLNSPALKNSRSNTAANTAKLHVSASQPLITSSSDIRKIVWAGAVKLWLLNPKNTLIGTGVETFAFTYYLTRPASHNLTSEWDFIYNKAHNEYLNFLATTGLFGLLTYFILIFFSYLVFIKKLTPMSLALLSGLSGYLVAIFFGFSITPTTVLLYLFPALAISLTTDHPPTLPHPSPPSVPLVYQKPAGYRPCLGYFP